MLELEKEKNALLEKLLKGKKDLKWFFCLFDADNVTTSIPAPIPKIRWAITIVEQNFIVG
jgi:hypothetical protein